MDGQIVLEVRNICKVYPGVKALDDVSMDFRAGEVHAIIGENGAGKSTLIKAIAGAHAPSSGEIILNGRSYDHLTVDEAKANGIQVIYQEFANVPTMNAPDNVFLGKRTSKGWVVNDRERVERTQKIFEKLKVNIPLDVPLGDMSPAMQQIVEIAKAISDEVKILVMDEPTAPLTNNEIDMLFDIIRQLKAEGVSIIFISHRLEELPIISDRISILRDGRYIKTVNTQDVSRAELIAMMAGRELDAQYPERTPKIGDVILQVEDAEGNGVSGLNFELHQGEILGFAGLVGAGRTEAMQLVYGVAPLKKGSIRLHGKEQKYRHPSQAIAAGIGMIPEDRKKQGVFLDQSIRWNCVINIIKRISRFMVVDTKKEKETAQEYQERFSIKAPTLDQTVNNLSGGNQQKVALAKSMAAGSEVIIFDEPTRGIDVVAKKEIYTLINELAAAGKGVLVISSELPELFGICDRLLVFRRKRLATQIETAKTTQEEVMHFAVC